MLKLALRVLALTVVLQGASLVFAEEMIVTLLILATVALSTAALVMGREGKVESPVAERVAKSAKARGPVTMRSGVETPV